MVIFVNNKLPKEKKTLYLPSTWKDLTLTQFFCFKCVLVSKLQEKPEKVNLLPTPRKKIWKPRSSQQNIWQLY